MAKHVIGSINPVKFYQLADGRLWDVDNACFVDGPGSVVDDVRQLNFSSDVELAELLAFYDMPAGELTGVSEASRRRELARLDDKYLTLRVLAGLATGDEYALEQWRLHEEAAAPLRTASPDTPETPETP